jgi:hypothetical protein
LLATRYKEFLYAFQYLGQTDRKQVRESVAVTGVFPSLELETLTAGWQGEVRYLKQALKIPNTPNCYSLIKIQVFLLSALHFQSENLGDELPSDFL